MWVLLHLTPGYLLVEQAHSSASGHFFTIKSNGTCLTTDQIKPNIALSNLLLNSEINHSSGWAESFLEKKNVSSWFFPWTLGTTSPLKYLLLTHTSYNNLVTRRNRLWQSHFFLTAGGTVAPETWFLCLHGVKRLHGRLPLPPRGGGGVAMVLPGSPSRANSFRESR